MGGIQPRPFNSDSFGILPKYLEECIDGNKITMFGSFNCRYCRLAHKLFEIRKIPYKFISTSQDNTLYELHKYTKTAAVPQIFINGKYIGGYDQLTEWDYDGKLSEFSEYITQDLQPST